MIDRKIHEPSLTPSPRQAAERAGVEAAYARVEQADSERARSSEFAPQYRAKLTIKDEQLK